MKKIYSLISLSAILVATSCSDSNDPRVPETVPGQDVVFQAIMPASTRTAYGDLSTTSRPVYWSNGDLIQVASAQCEAGFDNATYRVEVNDAAQNYADRLVHNDPAGVRWGDETDYTKYKFFAIYPQAPLTLSGDNAEAAVYFSAEQNSVMTKVGDAWKPSTYDMDNNIMYAQPIEGQNQVQVNETTGETVANLQFNPFSTVLHLNFAGWKTDNTAATEGFTIFSVTVQSAGTSPIAGNFPLTMYGDGSTPTLGDAKGDAAASSSVKVNLNQSETLNGFLPAAGEAYECDIFMAPRSGQEIGKGWKIVLETSAGNWVFDLGQKTAAGSNLALTPGAIHVLNIPVLSIEKGWNYTPNAWLADIPDNVYFTEVSLPGAWYAYDGMNTNRGALGVYYGGNEGYQVEGTSIQDLFNQGIRAFQLETRMGSTTTTTLQGTTVVISGTGRTNKIYGGDDTYVSAFSITKVLDDLRTALSAQTASKEFVVLALSYTDGTSGGTADSFKKEWINGIASILSNYSDIIYNKEIGPNTTVADLRGRIVVLTTVDKEAENNVTTWPNSLFSYTNQSWSSATMNTSMISPMTWASWPGIGDNVAIGAVGQNPNNMYLNYTLANRTWNGTGTQPTGMPSMDNRIAAIESLISNSDHVYASKTHNCWYYIGAGGTYASNLSEDSDKEGPQNIAKAINPELIKMINAKVDEGKASPMGLVFINQCTGEGFSGNEIVEAIIRMNRRFKLLEIGGTQGGGTGTQTNIKSVIPTHSSGYNKAAGNGWNAF